MKKRISNIICCIRLVALYSLVISCLPLQAYAENPPYPPDVINNGEAVLPTVITDKVSYTAEYEAVLTGDVTGNGGSEIRAKGFVYWNRLTPDNRITEYTTESNLSESSMKLELAGLLPNTMYYFYAFAENSSGTGKGRVLSFVTDDGDSSPGAIVISPAYVRIAPGEEYTLDVSAVPGTVSGYELNWSSSDKDVVTVTETGAITGLSEGSAVITASTGSGRASADCIVEVKEPTETVGLDFSEWNMITNVSSFAGDGLGFDHNAAWYGGNYHLATAYLARWDGAVLEDHDAFPKDYTTDSEVLSDMYKECDPDYHVQDVDFLPPRNDPSDNDRIKSALMEYGAVYGVMKVSGNYFTEDLSNYYSPGFEDTYYDHAVTITGWDDNYPGSNFVTDRTPDGAPGDGAFICKNSWGTMDGFDGFFYISYYDAFFSRYDPNAVIKGVEKNTNYNTIYQYDPMGMTSYEYDADTIYAANIFPEQGSALSRRELLRAVSFYTNNEGVQYEVFVLPDIKKETELSMLGAPVAKGTIRHSGYHTIRLERPITLEAGTRFAVAVRFYLPGGVAHAPIEEPFENYSSNARANPGESYTSSDGIDWYDVGYENANCCIKAFTDNGLDPDTLYQAIDNRARAYVNDTVCSFEEAVEKNVVSDAYIDFMERIADGSLSLASEDKPGFGTVPGFVKTDTATTGLAVSADSVCFPDRYDLRDLGLVSPVRDQADWDACWAFAICASLESCDMRNQKEGRGMYADPLSLTLSRSELALNSGSAFTLSARLSPANVAGADSISWKVSDSAIVSVDENGTVRPCSDAAGTAVITASAANGTEILTAECTVTVTADSNLTLEEHSVKKQVGDRFMLTYYSPYSADSDFIEWVSADPMVAAVDANGVITAAGNGTTEITVRSQDGTRTDTATVIAGNGLNYATVGYDLSGLVFSDTAKTLSGSVKIAINGNSAKTRNAYVLFMVYDPNGVLKGITPAAIELNCGINEVEISDITVSDISSDYSLRCMIWNDLHTMLPLAEKAELAASDNNS